MKSRFVWMSLVIPFLIATLPATAWAETVVLAVPGPGTLSYLPVYLAKAIAADQAEGLELKLRYVPGGPVALRDLQDRNSDFVAVGLAALASARADGMPVVAIGQLSQSAMYVFMLRSDLKNQVRSIAQLKGRRIGVASSTVTTRSMGHMMTEYLIHRAGLANSDVQFISVGQNRDTQRAALSSGTADAVMGDEPFASELVAQGIAVKLADLYQPKQSAELLGDAIVHAALATREDVLAQHPDTVKKVLRMYDRTLQWMAQHTAQETIDKLADQPGFNPGQGKLLVQILQRNHGMYPSRIAWDNRAVATTERFFHDTAINPHEISLSFADFVHNSSDQNTR
jgi:NitT/TauT family transport system substrate-binding protein